MGAVSSTTIREIWYAHEICHAYNDKVSIPSACSFELVAQYVPHFSLVVFIFNELLYLRYASKTPTSELYN